MDKQTKVVFPLYFSRKDYDTIIKATFASGKNSRHQDMKDVIMQQAVVDAQRVTVTPELHQ